MIFLEIGQKMKEIAKVRIWLLNIVLLVSVFGATTVQASGTGFVSKLREISDSDKPTVIMKYFEFSDSKGLRLTQVEGKFQGGNDNVAKLLNAYYTSMSTGKLDQAAELFYSGDGSRERFLAQIAEYPEKYEGYKKLKRVDVEARYGWGPFQVVKVTLKGDQLTLGWREAVICDTNACYLSNAIDAPSEKFDMFGHYVRMPDSKLSQAELSAQFEKGSIEYWLPDNAHAYGGFTQYPVAISSQLTDTVFKRLQLGSSKPQQSKASGVDYRYLLGLIDGVKKIGEKIEEKKQDEIDQDAIANDLQKVLQANADMGNTGYEFNFASQFKQDNRYIVEWYHPIAAIQRMSRWTAMTVIGYAEMDQRLAVYVQPEIGQDKEDSKSSLIEPVQLFILKRTNKGEWRPSLEGKHSKYAFLYDDQVLKSIQEKHGKKVTFIYKHQENPS